MPKQKEIPCKKCDKGVVWVTVQQVETGNTTKGMKRAKCSCCRGYWWDCKNCAAIRIKEELER